MNFIEPTVENLSSLAYMRGVNLEAAYAELEQSHAVCRYLRSEVERLEAEVERLEGECGRLHDMINADAAEPPSVTTLTTRLS
jgi:cell division protein FtsB